MFSIILLCYKIACPRSCVILNLTEINELILNLQEINEFNVFFKHYTFVQKCMLEYNANRKLYYRITAIGNGRNVLNALQCVRFRSQIVSSKHGRMRLLVSRRTVNVMLTRIEIRGITEICVFAAVASYMQNRTHCRSILQSAKSSKPRQFRNVTRCACALCAHILFVVFTGM